MPIAKRMTAITTFSRSVAMICNLRRMRIGVLPRKDGEERRIVSSQSLSSLPINRLLIVPLASFFPKNQLY